MSSAGTNQQLLKQAQDTAAELIALLRAWIPKRRQTVRTLRDIAAEIDNVQENVNIAKTLGYTTSIFGGIIGVAGVLLTGGLAAPLLVGGAMIATGTVTNTGATVIGGLVSEEKLQKAQDALDADKILVTQIEEKKITLERLATDLSHSFRLKPEEYLGFLIMTTLRLSHSTSQLFRNPYILGTGIVIALYLRSIALKMLPQTIGKVGESFAAALFAISIKGLAGLVRSVLAATVGGVLIAWDVKQLAETIYDLTNKSKTAVTRNLRKIAGKLAEQTQALERTLEQAQQQGQDFETMINRQFRQRLEAISKKGYATDDEVNEVYEYLQAFTTSEWQQHFVNVGGNLKSFVFEIARVLHLIYNQVERHTRTERRRERELTVIVIAHGRISTTLMFPVGLYYPTDHMKAVTLYEPWGCSIDASVVYGILENSIQLENVSYSGEVYRNQIMPEIPSDWNNLRKNEVNLIPTPIFSPVLIGEGAYRDLMNITGRLQLMSDGLVIPYFTGDGKDILPFPEVLLYVITTVLALIGSLTDTYIKLRVAACLSVPDGDIARLTGVINCWQYYVVSPNENVKMTNRFTDQERDRLSSFNLNDLNKFL